MLWALLQVVVVFSCLNAVVSGSEECQQFATGEAEFYVDQNDPNHMIEVEKWLNVLLESHAEEKNDENKCVPRQVTTTSKVKSASSSTWKSNAPDDVPSTTALSYPSTSSATTTEKPNQSKPAPNTTEDSRSYTTRSATTSENLTSMSSGKAAGGIKFGDCCLNITEEFGLSACPEKCNNFSSEAEWCIRKHCICNGSITTNKKSRKCEANCIRPVGDNCSSICNRILLANMSSLIHSNQFSNATVAARTADYDNKTLIVCECGSEQPDDIPNTFGWTLIQRRTGTNSNFSKSWEDYVRGFFHKEDFWAGLQKLVYRTRGGAALQIEMGKKANGIMKFKYIRYSLFIVSPSTKNFSILAEAKNGTDSLNHLDPMHKMPQFSIDEESESGWWFIDNQSNPNGKHGIFWGNEVYDIFQMKILPGGAEVPVGENCDAACKDASIKNLTIAFESTEITSYIGSGNSYERKNCCCFSLKYGKWKRDLLSKGWHVLSNGLAYKYFHDKAKYTESENRCRKDNARLASTGMRNATIREELFNTALIGFSFEVWIGLKGTSCENSGHYTSCDPWKWSDNVTGLLEVLPWSDGDPNHKKDTSCVRLKISREFADQACTNEYSFLCEIQYV